MPFNEKLAKLQKAKSELLQLEAQISAERVAALSKLPADFGYASLSDFIDALKGATKVKGAPKTPKAPKPAKAERTGKRAKITEEIKAEVKALAEAGKTGQEIAKALGISAPSVQNIKKLFGLVKSRTVAPAVVAAEVVPEVAPVEAAPAEVASV